MAPVAKLPPPEQRLALATGHLAANPRQMMLGSENGFVDAMIEEHGGSVRGWLTTWNDARLAMLDTLRETAEVTLAAGMFDKSAAVRVKSAEAVLRYLGPRVVTDSRAGERYDAEAERWAEDAEIVDAEIVEG